MGRQNSESTTNDDMDELFEPALGDNFDEVYESVTSSNPKQQRLADMRRRAEERLEKKRLQEEIGYFDLEWED